MNGEVDELILEVSQMALFLDLLVISLVVSRRVS